MDARAFQKSVEDYLNRIAEESFSLLQKAGQEMRTEAVRKTPVDTGVLRANWKVRSSKSANGGWIEVSNETKYAIHVEYGTRNTAPQPMIRPAVSKVLPWFLERLGKIK